MANKNQTKKNQARKTHSLILCNGFGPFKPGTDKYFIVPVKYKGKQEKKVPLPFLDKATSLNFATIKDLRDYLHEKYEESQCFNCVRIGYMNKGLMKTLPPACGISIINKAKVAEGKSKLTDEFDLDPLIAKLMELDSKLPLDFSKTPYVDRNLRMLINEYRTSGYNSDIASYIIRELMEYRILRNFAVALASIERERAETGSFASGGRVITR